MGHNADRMRDEIHRVATGDMESVLGELGKLAESITRHADAQNRLLLGHSGEIAAIWEEIADLRDEHHSDISALSNRLHAFGDAAAMRSDLDDLRLEVMEAVSTPFDPPEAA